MSKPIDELSKFMRFILHKKIKTNVLNIGYTGFLKNTFVIIVVMNILNQSID